MMEPYIYVLSLKEEIESALFSSLLSIVRKEKAGRILAQKKKSHADTMLAGELLAMYAIREVFGIPMSKQQIQNDVHGKPFLSRHDNIHFNISHSGNEVAVAVCDRPVGIDIERMRPWREPLARRICTPEEWERLQKARNKEEALTKLWTQKEAAVKMKGEGLSGLKNCSLENICCFTKRRGETYVSCAWEQPPGKEVKEGMEFRGA